MHAAPRGLRRLLAGGLAAAVVATAFVAAAVSPARAETVTDTGLGNYLTMAVEPVHQLVLLAGSDATGWVVQARGWDGTLKSTVRMDVDEIPGDIAVAPGGAAFYVRTSTNRLLAVSTTTFAVTPVSHGLGCLWSIAFSGSTLWAGTGCFGTSTGFAPIDVGTSPPTVGTTVDAPFLDGIDIAGTSSGTALYVLRRFGTQENISRLDVTTTPPSVTTAVAPAGCWQVVAQPGAGEVFPVGCTGQTSATGFHGSDLTAATTYPGPGPVGSVAVTDSLVAVAANVPSATDVVVLRAGSPTVVRSIDLGTVNGVAEQMNNDGLAFAPDGSKLFVMSWTNQRLHIIDSPAPAPVALTLSAPATAPRAVALTLTGTLTASPALPAGTTLTVTKRDLLGIHALASVTTSGTGGFTIHDTPGAGGDNTYTVAYPGSTGYAAATASKVVAVSRALPLLTVAANDSVYAYNGLATVTAHLGPTFTNRVVKVYAQPAGGTKVLVTSGTVNAAGNLVVTRRVTRRTTFTVVFAGDARYAPRAASRTVTSQIALGETMSKYYATSSGYYLYRTTVNPTLTAKATPNKGGQCVRFVAQRYSAGAWRAWASSACTIHFDNASVAAAFLAGSHPRGVKFRMRAEFPGDSTGWNAATSGAWKYYRFP